MPLNRCQTEKVVARGIRSLCEDCLDSKRCVKKAAHDNLALVVRPGEHQLSAITECGTYRPSDARPAFNASLWPQLIVAGVRHSCDSCPADELKRCGYRHALVSLTVASKRAGENLEATVYCCGEASALSRLHQIDEPRGG